MRARVKDVLDLSSGMHFVATFVPGAREKRANGPARAYNRLNPGLAPIPRVFDTTRHGFWAHGSRSSTAVFRFTQ